MLEEPSSDEKKTNNIKKKHFLRKAIGASVS